jgi:hypothetical protein
MKRKTGWKVASSALHSTPLRREGRLFQPGVPVAQRTAARSECESEIKTPEIPLNSVPERQDAVDSCGKVPQTSHLHTHGGYIEIGKEHGPEEDLLHQGRRQAQGTPDKF